MAEDVLTLLEAAKILRISKDTAYRLLKDGTFPVPVQRVGTRYRVSGAALRRFVDGDSNGVTPAA